uniref:Uncharacterized protein n=1 Tax=Anopheles farauti TaxID=69004 RepID=A0A182QY96_9DIPT
MKVVRILQSTVLVLGVLNYIPCRVAAAQFALRGAHVLSLEDYDSDELVPLVPRIRKAGVNDFKRNYRSHAGAGNGGALATPENLVISEDLVKHLRSVLGLDSVKQKLERVRAPKTTEKYTTAATTPTPVTVSTIPMVVTTTNKSIEVTESSREVAKRWFPVLLQEAIDNVLQKNGSEYDELDELVDHIAAGSGTYRYEAPPENRLDEPTVTFHNSLSGMIEKNGQKQEPTADGSGLPSFTQWYKLDQFGSCVPYVVNIFNNTKIGYIVMKVANDSEIRVESDLPESKFSKGSTITDADRKTRKIPAFDETELPRRKSASLKSNVVQQLSTKTTLNESSNSPYFYKTTPSTSTTGGGSQTLEPPFFNILKTPDQEPIKYRVLLRNNDNMPEKVKIRLPYSDPLPKSLHPVQVLAGDRRTSNGAPKRKPSFFSAEKPMILSNRNPLSAMIDVQSVEFGSDSRPARRHDVGRILRKFNYESLEDELPYEETDFTYPDTNLVTQQTAKILSTGKHNPSTTMDLDEKRMRRTTLEPYSETQRYNFRRTFGSTESDQDSLDKQRASSTPTSKPDSTNIPDLPGDDVLFNQATTNGLVKTRKDSKQRESSSRKQLKDNGTSSRMGEMLKASHDTSGDVLSDLFERQASKRSYKRSGHRWGSKNGSSDCEESSST